MSIGRGKGRRRRRPQRCCLPTAHVRNGKTVAVGRRRGRHARGIPSSL